MPRFILIHPTVWPQYTNVTDRQTGQTENGLIAYGEPFLANVNSVCLSVTLVRPTLPVEIFSYVS